MSNAEARLDEFPIVPYLAMPRSRSPTPEPRPSVKKQKIAFSGSAMDDQDAKWYGEDHSGMPHEQVSHASSHMAIDQVEDTPSMVAQRPGNSSSTVKRSPDNNNNSTSRKLARLDSEQAVDAYSRDLTAASSSNH